MAISLPSCPFPVDQVLPNLIDALLVNEVVILKAAPGAGKTTRVPPCVLLQPWVNGKKILMLEPRRLAARHSAEFMAQACGESVGETFGYRVRLDQAIGPNTRVEVITEGMLSQLLLSDPELSEVAAVIFDEFHERNLASDLGLGMVLETREHFREDLRVMVMSATMDESVLLKLIPDAVVIQSDGRQYPVDIEYHSGPETEPDLVQVCQVVKSCFLENFIVADELQVSGGDDALGDVLVFLPGAREVDEVVSSLRGWIESNPLSSPTPLHVYPLYGKLSFAEQRKATGPKPKGTSSIVVSTDIAETSLTIPNIRFVVDAGFSRVPEFDANLGTSVLRLARISKDSADQRAGRAGRVSSGKAHRLWSQARHKGLLPARKPEIENTPLDKTVLTVLAWGSSLASFRWVTAPSEGRWQQTQERLRATEALVGRELTAMGQALFTFPMEPLLARIMLTGQDLGCGSLAALLTTWWRSRDATRQGSADLEQRLEQFHAQMIRQKNSDHQEYIDVCRRVHVAPSRSDLTCLLPLMLKACPERIAIKREDSDDRYVLAEGMGGKLGQHAMALKGSDFLCCPILRARPKGEPSIEVALPIQKSEMMEHLGDQITDESVLTYDTTKKKVVARRERRWLGLVLEVLPSSDVSSMEKEACFWKMVQSLNSFSELPLSVSALAWLNRYRMLQADHSDLPPLGADQLMVERENWLQPYMAGVHSWDAFEKLNWLSAIQGMVPAVTLAQLDQVYPSHVTLANGMRKALDYSDPAHPVLALRIQELFGCSSVPKIGPNQQMLTLHLLSPARRPVQITADLESFWKIGYFEVRKELKRRYPKHLWPDDPAHAELADRYRR